MRFSWKRKIRVLRLEPDDVIVFTLPNRTTGDMKRLLAEDLRGVFPGHRIVVADSDAKLEIVRRADAGSPE